ncbi:MAG TPA: LuxR C-terminal-related transcriptional regulator [Solirubrobacteraceae bacterium]|nr:LuxR C-terminal-related transcriptional regulator [Solirubrobacteraceae bacterium]
MLLGREAERRVVDELLQSARTGSSAVLVLRGEAGIGKTSLLGYAESRAAGMTVLRSVGIEAEHELPFAGLHQLVRPCLGLLDRLPPPQATALRGAFGLSFDVVENPFLVSLGLLSLLAEKCEEAPVLCLIDDAQWLDRPSQAALEFAARRLDADPIAVLMAARTQEPNHLESSGLPQLELVGLDDDAAGLLLRSRFEQPAAEEVVRLLLRTAHGNPLALLELPAGLTAGQLGGAEPIVGPPPAHGALEQAFRARVAALPPAVRAALLLAAAEQTGDLQTLERALELSGVSVSALAAAQDAGLVRVNGALEFRHPLVRSAVYGSASHSERRTAHETLAAVLEDPVSSAWHVALMSDRADEAIAVQLDGAGANAVARGAHATAAAAFERAAELSEDPSRKGQRLLWAAQTSLAAGRSQAALALVDRAEPLVQDRVEASELGVVRAAVSMREGSPDQTFSLARTAALALGQREPERALEMVSLMIWAAATGGWAASGLPDAHAMLAQISGGGPRRAFMGTMLDGAMALLHGDTVAAGDLFADALTQAGGQSSDVIVTQLAGLVGQWIADFAPARDRFARVVAQRRADGLLTELAGSLPLLAIGEMCTGHLQAASEATVEGLELLHQLGYEQDEISYLALQAWAASLVGNEQECRELAESALQRGLATGVGWATGEAHLALGLLELGLGDAGEAIGHFEQLDPGPFPPTMVLATPEFIDAALRLGEPERARLALERFEAWAAVSRTPLVAGMLVRCRGVMADDAEQADLLFREALRHHDLRMNPYERARTQLAYGERLRRDRRRVEARIQLRAALATFEGLGAGLWAERARGELRATGETARKRDPSTIDTLTPQELRVARLVAAGASNKRVAEQLFLSRRTVEYHLGKVFVKLGVNSRLELTQIQFDPVLAVQDS